MTEEDGFPDSCRLIRGEAEFRQWCARTGQSGPEALGGRESGAPVTDRRSSWVRRLATDAGDYFVKTYDYPTARDRRRGAFRNTFLRPSRAAREWDALAWLGAAGFPGPRPIAAIDYRRRGWLRRAVLLTEAWPGQPLDHLVATLPPPRVERLRAAVIEFVSALHRKGFRDGNMDPRNVLAQELGSGEWSVAKIDSPRYRIVAPGRVNDRRARRDWQRLSSALGNRPIETPPSTM